MCPQPEDPIAAAFSHQLKTPVSSLQAAATNLKRNLRGLLEDLATMAGAGSPSGATAAFIARVLDDPAPSPLTGLLPQDRLTVIVRRLTRAGLRDDLEGAAASLIRGGWDTYMEEIAPLLIRDQALALEILETAARLRSNLSVMETALRRIKDLGSTLTLLAPPAGATRIDLEEGLRSTARMVMKMFPESVSLSVNLDRVPPVSGRAELLNELWSNLLTNAAQAVGEKGTILIEGGPGEIQGKPCSSIRVIDDGPGIPADALPRIFEPFFTTRAASGGTGLGLAVAHRIVERLGGTISVESRPGRTCFEVRLPALAAATQGRW